MYQGPQFGKKYGFANISYLNSCPRLGIIINSQWYKGKLFVIFFQDNKNKFIGINPIGLIAPRVYSLEIFILQPVKRMREINPMGSSAPCAKSIDINALDPVNDNL